MVAAFGWMSKTQATQKGRVYVFSDLSELQKEVVVSEVSTSESYTCAFEDSVSLGEVGVYLRTEKYSAADDVANMLSDAVSDAVSDALSDDVDNRALTSALEELGKNTNLPDVLSDSDSTIAIYNGSYDNSDVDSSEDISETRDCSDEESVSDEELYRMMSDL